MRWLILGGYMLLVLASLPLTRDVLIAMRQHNLLGVTVTGSYFLAVVVVVYHMVFDVRLSDRVAFAALVVLSLAIGGLVLGMSIPEERIHFLQYGVMAVLARWALGRHVGPWQQYIGAVLIAAAAGLADEIVQGMLPTRHYDTRDVAINALAALLTLAAYEALHNQLGWRPKDEAHPDHRR